MVEMALAIIVVALPGLKPLLDRSTKHRSPVERTELSHEVKNFN